MRRCDSYEFQVLISRHCLLGCEGAGRTSFVKDKPAKPVALRAILDKARPAPAKMRSHESNDAECIAQIS
jgi:hypothetical protein